MRWFAFNKINHSVFMFVGLLQCFGLKRTLSESGRSERSSERAKAIVLWLWREWLSVWGAKGGSVGVGSPLSALGASDTVRWVKIECGWINI